MSAHEYKDVISKQFAAHRLEVTDLANWLHTHPETAWQEFESSRRVAELLGRHGFTVTHPYLNLETAFRAVLAPPNARFTVGFLAEYDALPGLGHACGHNLIAAMSVGAALAFAPVASMLGINVEVIGTPAEEGGGGKIELLERGAFTNLDFVCMAHPAPVDVAKAQPFAVAHWHVRYEGKAAHAAAYPDRATNANDAFIIAQVAIGLLRQQLPHGVRVHGIQTVGGQAPNAIPGVTEGRWYVRAETMDALLALEERVTKCFEAGALATGSKLTITPESKRYADMNTDDAALDLYRANALELGRNFDVDPLAASMARASTDMGNVSQIVNAIHPYIGVGTDASNHQPEFADACVGEIAEQTLRDGAIGLAWTALDVALTRIDPKPINQ